MKGRRPPSLAPADIRAAAFSYLERFDASPERLRAVLRRRVMRARRAGVDLAPDDEAAAEQAIDAAVEACGALGLVDADGYAARRVDAALRRGASPRGAFADAAAKGGDVDAARRALTRAAENDPDYAKAAARAYLKRRRLGPFAPTRSDEGRDRAMTALLRRGFAPDTARAALDDDDD